MSELYLNKIWCERSEKAGVRVISLQHDGIVAVVGAGGESDRAAEGMAKEATAACGYGVKVIPKRAPIVASTDLQRDGATGWTE